MRDLIPSPIPALSSAASFFLKDILSPFREPKKKTKTSAPRRCRDNRFPRRRIVSENFSDSRVGLLLLLLGSRLHMAYIPGVNLH